MSDERQQDSAPDPIRPASDPVAALRLRPARPRVARLSRKVLTGGAAIALVTVPFAVAWLVLSLVLARMHAERSRGRERAAAWDS